MEISINWDLSGFKYENSFELVAFALNKNGKCKNRTGCIGNMQDSDIGIKHKILKQFGSNNQSDHCISIQINENELPFYCKEIMIFAYNNNALVNFETFGDLEFFNVFKNGLNIYSLPKDMTQDSDNKSTGILHIGNLVRVKDEFEFSPEFKWIKKDLKKLGEDFDIQFILES